MKNQFKRNVFFYREYFMEFFEPLPDHVKEKITWTLNLIVELERIPTNYFKYLTSSSGLYEIRIEYSSNIYRVFSFFDEGNLLVVINGFQKKSNKVPLRKIELAEKLKKNYFDEKENGKHDFIR